MIIDLPEGAALLSTGLYVYRYQITIGGIARTLGELYSSEGYCFYDNLAEVYDEEGNVIAPEDIQPIQRLYAQYSTLPIALASKTNTELAARFISVPVEEGFEIVSVPNGNVTI